MSPHLTVCEFYSGIGGYHIALSSIPHLSYTVTAAFEISSNANLFYRHNFPDTNVLETNLCGLTAQKLDNIVWKGAELSSNRNTLHSNQDTLPSNNMTSHETAALFVMSPPCQPFTRQGCKKDHTDPRSESVLHLFDIFPDLQTTPDYFFIENVQGFESSITRDIVMKFFQTHGYHVVEFLLNSNSLGIPNSRLRYYLLARKKPFSEELTNQGILSTIPGYMSSESPTPPLSTFLEEDPSGFDLSDTFLAKWGWVLDIVTPDSRRSCCFTKGYSVKAEGSGSVIQQTPDIGSSGQTGTTNSEETGIISCEQTESHAPSDNISPLKQSPNRDQGLETHGKPQPNNSRSLSNSRLKGEEFVSHMRSLNLRYFTPREIARIHGIPEWVGFPPGLSNKQLYKLLGNGLNVTVVRVLIERVLLS